MLGSNGADDEKARIGENTLWMSKCHAWAVLTRAKCHGALLTLNGVIFYFFTILFFYCNTTKAKEEEGYKRAI